MKGFRGFIPPSLYFFFFFGMFPSCHYKHHGTFRERDGFEPSEPPLGGSPQFPL